MNKKAYIDPITDYLLHDPEQISTTGSLARGALTAGGLAGGAIGTNKLVNVINNLAGTKKVPGKAKIGLMLGSALGLGGAGHWFGTEKFKYTPGEQLHNKLDSIKNILSDSSDTLKDVAENTKAVIPDSADTEELGLWEKLKDLVKPKSSFDKFKDSSKAMWENLKDVGLYGWESIKDAVN